MKVNSSAGGTLFKYIHPFQRFTSVFYDIYCCEGSVTGYQFTCTNSKNIPNSTSNSLPVTINGAFSEWETTKEL